VKKPGHGSPPSHSVVETGQLPIVIEDFDRSAPAFVLSIVDLSKVKHLPLDNLATPAAPILHHAPIAMLFAVFNPCVAP